MKKRQMPEGKRYRQPQLGKERKRETERVFACIRQFLWPTPPISFGFVVKITNAGISPKKPH